MKRRRRVDGRLAVGRAGCASVVFGSTKRSLECGGATIVIAAVGRSSAPVETAPAPAVFVSKEEEDLVARARALLSDAEPTPVREAPPVDDGLDVDMDLIRRARALRGASQLARTESK